ncbi:MAG: hypothetical protein ACRDRX_07390 [Pseudonocardiaceae bacterium]
MNTLTPITHYAGRGRPGAQLYQRYAVFRNHADEILAELDPANAAALRDWLNEPIRLCGSRISPMSAARR